MAPPAWAAGLDALGAGEGLTRYVGGAVRDELLGLPVSDVDLATRIRPRRSHPTAGGCADQGGTDRHRPWHDHRGQRRPSVRDHHASPRRLDRRPTRDGRLYRRLEGGRGHAATSRSMPCRPTPRPARFSIISVGSTILRSGMSGSSANHCSGLPRTICGSCASSAFTRGSAGRARSPALEACTARANDLMALSRERIADELLKLLGLADPAATVGDHAPARHPAARATRNRAGTACELEGADRQRASSRGCARPAPAAGRPAAARSAGRRSGRRSAQIVQESAASD